MFSDTCALFRFLEHSYPSSFPRVAHSCTKNGGYTPTRRSFSGGGLSPLFPQHTKTSRVCPLFPLHTQKWGVGGMSNQISFLRPLLHRSPCGKCRRADIFDFSSYFLHSFSARRSPASEGGRYTSTERRQECLRHQSLACPERSRRVTNHQPPPLPMPVTSRWYCAAIALGLPKTEPRGIPAGSGNPPKWAGMSPLNKYRCPDGND